MRDMEPVTPSATGESPVLWVIFETFPKVVSRGFRYSFLPNSGFSAVFVSGVSNGFTYSLLGSLTSTVVSTFPVLVVSFTST
jgi:hypothetical protein